MRRRTPASSAGKQALRQASRRRGRQADCVGRSEAHDAELCSGLPVGLPAALAACVLRLQLTCRAAAVVFMTALLHQPQAAAGSSVEYPEVMRGYQIEFPRDEGSHPDFRTEWWYITGWLETERGDPLGFQITFFRTRPGVDEENPSRFAARQLLFAHVAISDPKRGALLRDEKAAREGFGLAEAKQGRLDVRIDDWTLRNAGDRYYASLRARAVSVELEFTRTQPPMLHGDRGVSQKGPNPALASYYYSLPQLATSGRVMIEGREYRVRGVSWLDHEWMTSVMDAVTQGWDWIGLNFDDGGALMSLQMRNVQGRKLWAFGTHRGRAEGELLQRVYAPAEIEWTPLRQWRSARTGVDYPIEWKISVGGRTIALKPLMADQENDARGSTGTLYWEGAVRAFDEQGREIGRGYLELTGYGQRLRF
jgi:predicted secreted hydrolase